MRLSLPVLEAYEHGPVNLHQIKEKPHTKRREPFGLLQVRWAINTRSYREKTIDLHRTLSTDIRSRHSGVKDRVLLWREVPMAIVVREPRAPRRDMLVGRPSLV